MSSTGGHHNGHLDATAGREVVFCHACSSEWYRDEHGLHCPRCHSEITEIVSLENDPRDIHEQPSRASSSSGEHRFRRRPSYFDDNDSDPEEADIEEHMRHHGFDFNRSTRPGSHPHPHNPAFENVMDQFISMIHSMDPAQPGRGSNPGSPDAADPYRPSDDVRRTTHTFQTGPQGRGGTASVTFITGPPSLMGGLRASGGRGLLPEPRHRDPFDEIFSNVLRDIGAPHGEQREQAGAPPALARTLQELLGHIFNPANAVAGDAVYSQEALDRIISGLMEANPQSNAAPPASDDALSKLERRPVTKELLGGDEKTDCSICLDDIELGQTGAFLPCKHWFHEACVVAWLKAHNTCPVCRTPIEKSERGDNHQGEGHDDNDNGEGAGRGSQQGFGGQHGPHGFRPAPQGPSGLWTFRSTNNNNHHHHDHGSQNIPRHSISFTFGPAVNHHTRPPMPTQNQSRLNEAMRSVSSMQQRARAQAGDDDGQASASGFNYDTSRMQRRTSMSPTSTRPGTREAQVSRHRQRSPSSRSRRVSYDGDNNPRGQTQGGGGPISWLRDRFGGSGGSSRERRS